MDIQTGFGRSFQKHAASPGSWWVTRYLFLPVIAAASRFFDHLAEQPKTVGGVAMASGGDELALRDFSRDFHAPGRHRKDKSCLRGVN
jgi:hypothetical protein